MTFYLSPTTLEKAVCLCRYRYEKILHRRSAEIRSGADAGSAVHAGFRGLFGTMTQDEQEEAVLKTRAKLPMADNDYRHGDYLVAGLAQLRAELAPALGQWKVLEVEKRGERLLGTTPLNSVHPGWKAHLRTTEWNAGREEMPIVLRYIRDAVIRNDQGRVVIVDLKTSSRDEAANAAYFHNSGQFKAYNWSWNDEHPDNVAREVQPVRLIMRPPSKTGVTYTVKLDTPVRFDSEILVEWRRNTIRRAVDLLQRDPDDPTDWPMMESGLGTCRHTYGCCEFLPVCTKPPGDRALKLATDVFVDSRIRDDEPKGETR